MAQALAWPGGRHTRVLLALSTAYWARRCSLNWSSGLTVGGLGHAPAAVGIMNRLGTSPVHRSGRKANGRADGRTEDAAAANSPSRLEASERGGKCPQPEERDEENIVATATV